MLAQEPFPHAWLLERFDTLEQRLLEHSRAVRADMNTGFRDLTLRLVSQDAEVQTTRDRVLVIETQREEEAKQQLRRGAVGGIIAAVGLTAMWEMIRHALGWK